MWHASVHQPQDGLGDLSGSLCVCDNKIDVDYKSHRAVASVCVCADQMKGYCLALLLGNRRVTLWCNRGHEHISHSSRLYRKEKRGRRSLCGEVMGCVSPFTPALFSADFMRAPARNSQRWRHDPFPLQTMVVVEVHRVFFPIVSGLCWSPSTPRLWMGTEASSTASVAANTFMRPKYWWVTCGGQRGRKEDKLSC